MLNVFLIALLIILSPIILITLIISICIILALISAIINNLKGLKKSKELAEVHSAFSYVILHGASEN